jgi:molybdopterin molybdotransferase
MKIMEKKLLPVDEAIRIVLEDIHPLGTERVFTENACGRVLAEDVVSTRDIPYSDNSAMDGFAVISEDLKGVDEKNPRLLKIVEELPAGRVPSKRINSGECAKIMTGGIMPEGADAVVMVEDTEPVDTHTVRVKRSVHIGENVRFRGEDIKSGSVVLKEGTKLRPQEIGLLSALGKSNITVYQRPVVGILSTGSEIINIDEEISTGKVVDSNSYTLCSSVKMAGGIPLALGIARDTTDEIKRKILNTRAVHALITSGGVSVGEFDLVKDLFNEIGCNMKFWKVAIKPGKPFAYGLLNGIPLFGLPGNPVSSFVAFEVFVRPALLRMQGMKNVFRRQFSAVMTRNFKNKPGRKHFVRGILEWDGDKLKVKPSGEQGSAMLSTLVSANCFIVIPQDRGDIKAGESVNVIQLDEDFYLSPT